MLYSYDNSLDEEMFAIISDIFKVYITLESSLNNGDKIDKEKIFDLIQDKDYFKIQDMMNSMNLNFVDFGMNFYYNDMMHSKNKMKKLQNSYINSVQFNEITKKDSIINKISEEDKIYKNLAKNSFTHKILFTDKKLTTKTVQNRLSKDDTFISYYGSESAINCLIITSNQLLNIEISKELDEIKKIQKLNNYLNNSLDISNFSKELFNILIGPIYKYISNKKNLIFYSNIEILKNFPFDLLILNDESIDKIKISQELMDITTNNNYLIDFYNIAQLNYIFELDNKPNGKKLEYDNIFSFVNSYSAINEDLKFADKEFNSLKWEYENAVDFSKKEALESEFFKLNSKAIKDNERYLLHFPTHTFINKKDTVESYISLASDNNYDGKLDFSEILEYNNQNKDIVLSGCETGGKIGYEYDEYFDISSAFLLSGSESVVSTRWKANDLVTAVLMKRYFRFLKEGNSKIEALSRAKRIVKNFVKSYPYYWAGFKISGNWN